MLKYLMVGAVLQLFFTGCTHKDLCYDHNHDAVSASVKVIFDWKNAPDANPVSMSLYLFPKNGGSPERYEFTNKEGGTIRVIPGVYDAICINSDTEGVIYKNTESSETFEVTTRTTEPLTYSMRSLGVPVGGVPRADAAGSERIAFPPDMLWGDSKTEILVPDSETETTITLTPRVGVCTYRIEIINAENVEYITGLSAALSGMTGGLRLASGTMTAERVTYPFDMTVSEDKTTVSGELLTFGHCPDTQEQHALIVYAVLTDGSKFAYTYDAAEVTRQIHEAPDPRNVVIRLDGLKLPEPIPGGGGFQPEVGDWQEIEEEIEM